ELLLGFVEEAVEAVTLGQVDADAVALADLVDPLQTVLQVPFVAAASEDFDTLGSKQHANGAPDARRAAGNDRLAPLERRHFGVCVAKIGIGIGHFIVSFARETHGLDPGSDFLTCVSRPAATVHGFHSRKRANSANP